MRPSAASVPPRHTSDLLLGVDGGGSKTRALLAAPDGTILGAGEAGASNPNAAGPGRARTEVARAVAGAFTSAGLSPKRSRVAAACFGMAGVDKPTDSAWLREWLAEAALAPRFEVVNDCEILLDAGAPDAWGLALVSGTGSICWGRDRQGRTARAGGWGPLIGDEGSGYALSIAALRAAAKASDGRIRAPRLLAAVCAALAIEDPLRLIDYVHAPGRQKHDLAQLAPLVFALADAGDAAARRLIEEAAEELAAAVRAVKRRLRLRDAPLVLGGSLLRVPRRLRGALLARLRGEVGPIVVVDEPARGAIRRAAHLASENRARHRVAPRRARNTKVA